MRFISPGTYARWLGLARAAETLAEAPEAGRPEERLLQQVWLHQRLRRDALRTTDGRSLTVLHPGFWNREAGPDFRDAVLKFGDEPPVTGDVEIDLLPRGWTGHQHRANPAYRGVRLHVVWEASGPDVTGLPTLELVHFLDAPLTELRAVLGGLDPLSLPAAWRGACAEPLRWLAPAEWAELLQQAAQVRLAQKAAAIRARALQCGWSLALWEEVLAGLGYKHNAWPMRRLAGWLPRLTEAEPGVTLTVLHLQARLLGAAGLLPAEIHRLRPPARSYVQQLWEHWWCDRGSLGDCQLPPGLWRFHGVRPANHPARRLALAAHWLVRPDWEKRIVDWMREDIRAGRLPDTLRVLLHVEADPFWSRHLTMTARRSPAPVELLGEARVTDLAMNALLPWAWGQAEQTGATALRMHIEARYHAWPARQENAVVRLARRRWFASAPLPRPRKAADQQGVLQVVRDFCARSNALCMGCPFPRLVSEARDGTG